MCWFNKGLGRHSQHKWHLRNGIVWLWEMDELVKRIEAKRKVVQSTREAMKRAIENQNTASIQRQKNIIKKTVGEIYELKVEVQEIRIQKGDDEEEIQTWTNDMKLELEAWDNELENVSKWEWKRKEEEEAKLRDQELAAKERQDLFKEQLEFDKAKLEQQTQHEIKMEKMRKEQGKTQSTNAKLPKLVITKFNGTPLV